MSMTPKEVVRAVTAFQEPDRLPLFISARGVIRRQRGVTVEQLYHTLPEEQARSGMDIMRRYGGDLIAAGYDGTLAVKALGGNVAFRSRGAPDVLEPLIRDTADLDKIDPGRIKKDYYYQVDYEVSKQLIALAGEEYFVSTGFWGPFTQAGLLLGTESLMRKCLKDKNAVRDLLDFCVELLKICSEDIIDLGTGIGSLAEPTASKDMISRKVFEELALPYLKKVCDWYASKNQLITLHICGDIADRLDLMPETGANILSLDYKVSMKTAAETLGGKMVIAGNADPVDVIMTGSEETVRSAYMKILEEVEGVPYVLMAGCAIPSKTPLANLKVMRDIAYQTVPRYRPRFAKNHGDREDAREGR
jgi:uroporphyrinogen decarboxylase